MDPIIEPHLSKGLVDLKQNGHQNELFSDPFLNPTTMWCVAFFCLWHLKIILWLVEIIQQPIK